jgi:hypothetical protein
MHYLKEDTTVPSTQITILTDENKEAKVSNPDYTIWVAQDQRDLSYLLNLITKEILGSHQGNSCISMECSGRAIHISIKRQGDKS